VYPGLGFLVHMVSSALRLWCVTALPVLLAASLSRSFRVDPVKSVAASTIALLVACLALALYDPELWFILFGP